MNVLNVPYWKWRFWRINRLQLCKLIGNARDKDSGERNRIRCNQTSHIAQRRWAQLWNNFPAIDLPFLFFSFVSNDKKNCVHRDYTKRIVYLCVATTFGITCIYFVTICCFCAGIRMYQDATNTHHQELRCAFFRLFCAKEEWNSKTIWSNLRIKSRVTERARVQKKHCHTNDLLALGNGKQRKKWHTEFPL